jgi:hypothetical protein
MLPLSRIIVTEQSEAIRIVLRNVKTSDEIRCFFLGWIFIIWRFFFQKIIFYKIFCFKKKIAKYLLKYLKKCHGIVKYWLYLFLQILRLVHAGKHWFLISWKKNCKISTSKIKELSVTKFPVFEKDIFRIFKGKRFIWENLLLLNIIFSLGLCQFLTISTIL